MLSKKHSLSATAALLACCIALPLPVSAKITCCDVDGKRTCGDPAPQQCLYKSKTEFKGGVAKEVEAPLTPEQRAARDAAEARKKEEARVVAEQTRRDAALLASYSNEKEIDAARDRAISDIEKNASQASARLETAKKKQVKLNQEKEFYAKKPMPAQLESQIKDNDAELAAQQKILDQKEIDIAALKERYEGDKTRFRTLKNGTR